MRPIDAIIVGHIGGSLGRRAPSVWLIFCAGHETKSCQLSNDHLSKLPGEAMATVNILRLIKMGNLRPDQKAHLKKTLRDRKKELQASLKKVDQGLKLLAQKRK